MVVETVLAGVFGVVGSVVGYGVAAWANIQSTERQIESENRRRRGEYFLERKVEALMELHSTLKTTRRKYKFKADKVGEVQLSQEEVDELMEQFREYEQVKNEAGIFLDDDQQRTLAEVVGILLDVNNNLYNAVNNPPDSVERYAFGFNEFNVKFDEAEEVLKEEVKGPIDAFEESLSD